MALMAKDDQAEAAVACAVGKAFQITPVQQIVSSCSGAILTSLFGEHHIYVKLSWRIWLYIDKPVVDITKLDLLVNLLFWVYDPNRSTVLLVVSRPSLNGLRGNNSTAFSNAYSKMYNITYKVLNHFIDFTRRKRIFSPTLNMGNRRTKRYI